MPHPPQAKKRHRQSLRHAERNSARRSAVRTAVRRARELIESGKKEEAAEAVREAGIVLDRAASKGVLHANNAARRKSRLVRHLNAGARTKSPAKKTSSRSRSKKS